MSKLLFLAATIAFVVSIFVTSHQLDWISGGLAGVAAGLLLEDGVTVAGRRVG